jgi:hypothetical protein
MKFHFQNRHRHQCSQFQMFQYLMWMKSQRPQRHRHLFHQNPRFRHLKRLRRHRQRMSLTIQK